MLVGGQEDDFSLHCVLHIMVRNRNLEACPLSSALLTEQVGQTCVHLGRSQVEPFTYEVAGV